MPRVTTKAGEKYTIDNIDVAIERLGKLEDTLEEIRVGQAVLSSELEKLRNEGKKSSTKFRELMGKKLTNSIIISIFEDLM